jgi:hypothetical protein
MIGQADEAATMIMIPLDLIISLFPASSAIRIKVPNV